MVDFHPLFSSTNLLTYKDKERISMVQCNIHVITENQFLLLLIHQHEYVLYNPFLLSLFLH